MIYTQLSESFSQIEKLIQHSPNSVEVNEKLLELATTIKENGQAIQDDLIKHSDHLSLIQKIGQIKAPLLHDACALVELKALLKTDNPNRLAEWVLKNKDGVSSENKRALFEDLSNAREQLSLAKLLVPEVGNTLSSLITAGLGLKGQKNAATVKAAIDSIFNQSSLYDLAIWINTNIMSLGFERLSDLKRGSLEALAHWINTEKIPLDEVNLRFSELEIIAPYLHYVSQYEMSDFKDLTHGNPQRFLNLCSNAYEIWICSDNITELTLFSPNLQIFSCNHSKHLIYLHLTECKKLKKLYCNYCSLSIIDLSRNKELQELEFRDCSHLGALDLSNNPQLKELEFSGTQISTLDLSYNLLLERVSCNRCQNLETLDLSKNRHLKWLSCVACKNLTSIGHLISNTLVLLWCQNCVKLTQLPQVPKTERIFSGNGRYGGLSTLEVYPIGLEIYPDDVLWDLGDFLLQNKPFPNLVYMDPATKEPIALTNTEGLRHEFVATLCANLFRQGSDFPFVKDGDFVIPACNTPHDHLLLIAFARLLGFAAVNSTPTGTNLPPSFFASLFSLQKRALDRISYDQPLEEPIKEKLYMVRHGILEGYFLDKEHMEKETNILTATAIIAKELHSFLGPQIWKFQRNIIERVQGTQVTKESFKQSIHCTNDQYKEWINSFIDKFPYPLTEKDGFNMTYRLKDFYMLLTSSYTSSGETITFNVNPDPESEIVIRICSKTIELPGNLDEELLHQKLKERLTLLKSINTA